MERSHDIRNDDDRFGPRRLSVEGESTSGSCVSRNNYIGLSVVQVRMASPGCLTDGCPQCPSHKSRLLTLIYLLTHPPARGSGAEDQQAGDHSGQH